jgi:hypothetical protein
MNEFSEKSICRGKWRKQLGNEGSSGTHKKEKWHLFLGEKVLTRFGEMSEPGFGAITEILEIISSSV